jgi:sortase (surface protein transpeptidase)
MTNKRLSKVVSAGADVYTAGVSHFLSLERWQFSIGLVAIGLLAVVFGAATGPLNGSLRGLAPVTPVVPTTVPTPVPPTATAMPTETARPTLVPATPAPGSDAATVVAMETTLAILGQATATPVVTPTASPSPAPVATVPNVATGRPLELQIPRIGVVAPVEAVGVDRDGAMAAPSGPFRVGWFDLGYYPGEPGNAVIDGHVDYVNVGPAVFWRLGELHVGDTILVTAPPKQVLTFVVERTAVYPYNDAPIKDIFGPSDVPRLNLVTCTGVFNRATRNYDRRLVVFAKLAGAS